MSGFFHSHNVFKVHLRCNMDHTLWLNNVPLNVSNDFLVHSFLGNSGLIETQSASEPLAASRFHAHMAVIIPRALAKTVVPGLLYFSLSCPAPLSPLCLNCGYLEPFGYGEGHASPFISFWATSGLGHSKLIPTSFFSIWDL